MDFTKPWDLGDLTLIVQKKKLYVNRHCLAMWSPVMKVMLCGDFKEKMATEVPLPEKKFDDILELMKVMHPPVKPIDEQNVHTLLPLIHEYDIKDLMKRCEDFLMSRPPSVLNYVEATAFDFKKLQEICFKYMQDTTAKDLLAEEAFSSVEVQIRERILREKCTSNEDDLIYIWNVCQGNSMPVRNASYSYRRERCQNTSSTSSHYPGENSDCETCCLQMIKMINDNMKKIKWIRHVKPLEHVESPGGGRKEGGVVRSHHGHKGFKNSRADY